MKRIGGRGAWALAALLLGAFGVAAEEKPDPLLVVHKIKAEAYAGSHVADHLFWLTDVNGPRLTNSPGYKSAAAWAVERLKSFGASKPHLESWGPFGRGWSSPRWSLQLVAPTQAPLAAVPRAWSGGTSGPVKAEVVYAPFQQRGERDDGFDLAKQEAKIAAYAAAQKGKLRGKIVLFDAARDLNLPTTAAGSRYDDQKLAAEVAAPEPVAASGPVEWPIAKMPSDPKKRQAFFATTPFEVAAEFSERRNKVLEKLWAFFAEEQPAAVLVTDERGEGGLIFVQGLPLWGAGAPNPPPALVLAPEAYDRLVRLTEKKVPVQVEVDVTARFHDETDSQNVVAELPGGKKKDEVVIIGAHLDSWHGATGATDNAAGVAIMLEAVRILKALDLPLDRTVRIVLWSGEEQGLLGSRAYVKEHFGDSVTMALKGEHAKVAAYFNADNGAGKIRGVYLQGNDMVRPIFEKWLAPFRDQGATALSIRNTGGTDHLSFDAVGLPGFQFIQDPLDYMSRTHHSDLDTADRALPADLMQASAVVASFVYNAANHPELLPRKPLPKPLPPKRPLPAATP
jgi:hypothetical protein